MTDLHVCANSQLINHRGWKNPGRLEFIILFLILFRCVSKNDETTGERTSNKSKIRKDFGTFSTKELNFKSFVQRCTHSPEVQ